MRFAPLATRMCHLHFAPQASSKAHVLVVWLLVVRFFSELHSHVWRAAELVERLRVLEHIEASSTPAFSRLCFDWVACGELECRLIRMC